MNIMPVATAPFVTEAKFLSLPESNQKAELVDGEVIVSPSPSCRHQEILARIVGALHDWARASNQDVLALGLR